MADNVAITAGSGTTIATDEVAGLSGHVQLVKIVDATADGSNRLIVDSSGRVTVVVVHPAGTPTESSVSLSASSFTIIAANTARKGLILFNDSGNILYVRLSGGTASTTNYSFQLAAGAYWQTPPGANFTGAVTGIGSAASGSVKVTEIA